jgi:hypothetical protein
MPPKTTIVDKLEKINEDVSTLCLNLTGQTETACQAIKNQLGTDFSDGVFADTQTRESQVDIENKRNLQDKTTLFAVLGKKSENLQQHIDNIKQEKMNKQRLVEASEWEYDRYNSHIYIFKFIFFSLVIINIILFIRKKVKMIPDSIYFGVIVLITAFMLYNVISEIATNLRRDKFDYDKLEQVYDSRFDGDDGVTIDKNKSKSGGIFHNLMCETFKNRKEDTLNRHNYSFIH